MTDATRTIDRLATGNKTNLAAVDGAGLPYGDGRMPIALTSILTTSLLSSV